jgi:hypothetical protein
MCRADSRMKETEIKSISLYTFLSNARERDRERRWGEMGYWRGFESIFVLIVLSGLSESSWL